jgi:hypothetical protein
MRTALFRLGTLLLINHFWMIGATAEVRIQVEGLLVVTECRGANYQQISTNSVSRSIIEIAASCVRMGAPVAVLTDGENGDRLYTLVSPSKSLARYIARYARLTGKEIAPRIVVPQKLEIRTPNGWIEVPTSSMM